MTISFIIPTIGRKSLKRTLDSIHERPGDEVIVVPDIPPSHMWGNNRRNEGMECASGDYLTFIDDDDWYAEGAREIMELAIKENPGRPNLFRMEFPNGQILWKEKKVIPGNIGTPMILVPNKKEMLHYWPGRRNMADFIFVERWKWPQDQIVWREEIIAYLDHNDGERPKG